MYVRILIAAFALLCCAGQVQGQAMAEYLLTNSTIQDKLIEGALTHPKVPGPLQGNPAITPILRNYEELYKVTNGTPRERFEGGVGIYENMHFLGKEVGGLFRFSIDGLSGKSNQK